MKKFLLSILVISCGFFTVQAQKGFHLGLHGGGGLVYIMNQNNYGGPEFEYSPKLGYMFGAEAGMNFIDHLGVQLEANYTRQGQNYEDKVNNVAIFRDVTLKYTQFPVMLKYSGGNYMTRFSAMFGPYWGYLNSATLYYKEDQVVINEKELGDKQDITNRFEKWDMGLVLDLGSDFKLVDNFYLSTSLRFNYGLKDINAPAWRIKSPTSAKYEKSTTGLGMVLVGVHYLFGGAQKNIER